jgi:polar amino acid transport system permease protein
LVAAAVITILVGLFLYGMATNPAYRWNIFAKYLFNDRILFGVWNTLQLTIYSMVLAIVLGVVLAVMRLSPNPIFRSVSWVFLWIFRGTPIYVQLSFWGLIPTIYAHIQLGVPFGPSFFHLNLQALSIPFILAMLGLALNEAAYMAEIIRAGISSVPEGQSEASTALGMSWGMTMRRTVIPQAMRVIIPPTGNEVISMLKTTSLVTAVPYAFDLYSIATREIAARTFEPVPLALVAVAWYLLMTSILMVGQYYLERYYSRGASRKLTTRQLEALAKAQQIGEAGHV